MSSSFSPMQGMVLRPAFSSPNWACPLPLGHKRSWAWRDPSRGKNETAGECNSFGEYGSPSGSTTAKARVAPVGKPFWMANLVFCATSGPWTTLSKQDRIGPGSAVIGRAEGPRRSGWSRRSSHGARCGLRDSPSIGRSRGDSAVGSHRGFTGDSAVTGTVWRFLGASGGRWGIRLSPSRAPWGVVGVTGIHGDASLGCPQFLRSHGVRGAPQELGNALERCSVSRCLLRIPRN